MSNIHCQEPSFAINYGINLALHITILFGVLSGLFILYISRIETGVIQDELHDAISDNLSTSLNNLSDADKLNLKLALKTVPLDQLIKLNSKPSEAVTEHNKMLFILVGAINLFLIISVVIVVGILAGSCGQCVPIGKLLIENFIIFGCVGVVEFLFFYFIVLHYVPVPPSLMFQSVINGLKKQF